MAIGALGIGGGVEGTNGAGGSYTNGHGGAKAKIRYVRCTDNIGYYDYRPVTLLFACVISFQRYALS